MFSKVVSVLVESVFSEICQASRGPEGYLYQTIIDRVSLVAAKQNIAYLAVLKQNSEEVSAVFQRSLEALPGDVIKIIVDKLSREERLSVSIPFCGDNLEGDSFASWLTSKTNLDISSILLSDIFPENKATVPMNKYPRLATEIIYEQIDLTQKSTYKASCVFVGHPQLLNYDSLCSTWDLILKNAHKNQSLAVGVTFFSKENDLLTTWYKNNGWTVRHVSENPFAIKFPDEELYKTCHNWLSSRKLSFDWDKNFKWRIGARYGYVIVADRL